MDIDQKDNPQNPQKSLENALQNPILEDFKLYKQRFEKVEEISHGGYGYVYKVKIKNENKYYALKKFNKKSIQQSEGIPVSGLREISILKEMSHENIEDIIDAFYGIDSLYILFDFYECDLGRLCTKCKYNYDLPEIKEIMYQLFCGLNALHKNCILHRDLKHENILLSKDGIVKIADFGLARFIASPGKPMTKSVVTVYYRPPEIFFGARMYSYSVDMWSAGCVLAYLLKKEILFRGQNEIEILTEIFYLLGVPNEENWPDCEMLKDFKIFKSGDVKTIRKEFSKFNKDAIDLLEKLLVLDPCKRISAEEAMKHPFFKNEPKPCGKEGLKKWVEYYKNNKK